MSRHLALTENIQIQAFDLNQSGCKWVP